MNRRVYLRTLGAAGAAGTAGLAGCLDSIPGLGDDTALGPPDQSLEAASHPSHGDELPDFSVDDPLAETSVSPADFEDERALLLTFFFTSCPDGACPALLLRLRRGQDLLAEEGLSDRAAFLAMTFDPEHDTADELERYGEEQGVDFEQANWHFLRPENDEEADAVVTDTLGIPFQKVDHDEHDHDDEEHDHGDAEYTFSHPNIVLLVNENGVVERVYPTLDEGEPNEVADDLLTVVTD